MKESLNYPLTPDELNDLGMFLDETNAEMSLEAVDGFFVALICSPEAKYPSDYFPSILGNYESYKDQDISKYFIYLTRHWNSISLCLGQKLDYPTLLMFEGESSVDIEDYCYDWALGFIEGMRLNNNSWSKIITNHEINECLLPILLLGKTKMLFSSDQEETFGIEEFKETLIKLPSAIAFIYNYFRQINNKSIGPSDKSLVKTSNKIGRNDPCPCGSHRKYKQCCGKN